MSLYLIALNELKSYLRIPSVETGLDAALAQMQAKVTAQWETSTGRTAAYTTYTKEDYQPGYSRDLALHNFPVDLSAPFSLLRTDQYGQVVIADQSDYLVNPRNGIVTLIGFMRFADRPDATQVTYAAGFKQVGTGDDARLDCPADLNSSCLDWAAAAYRGQVGALTPDDVAKVKKEAERNWESDKRIW